MRINEHPVFGELDATEPIAFEFNGVPFEARPGEPVGRWKVPGRTAIPRGTYKMAITHSPRFGVPLPLIINVPGFSGVRIHAGNQSSETEGCILVGHSWSGGDFIGQSRIAFNAIFQILQKAHMAGEPIELEIR
jgi:hypothetical protein